MAGMLDPKARDAYESNKRKHLPPDKPALFTFKDTATMAVSVAALLLSAITAFWTVIRVEERFSVVVRGPQLAFRLQKNLVSPEGGNTELAFVNSGNRPVYVSAVYIFFNTAKDASDCAVDRLSGRYVTTFKPMIVKDGEISMTTIRIDSIYSPNHPIPAGKAKAADKLIDLDETNRGETVAKAVSCLAVQFSTPSIGYREAVVSISSFVMIRDKAFFGSAEDKNSEQPALLHESFGSIFRRLGLFINSAFSSAERSKTDDQGTA